MRVANAASFRPSSPEIHNNSLEIIPITPLRASQSNRNIYSTPNSQHTGGSLQHYIRKLETRLLIPGPSPLWSAHWEPKAQDSFFIRYIHIIKKASLRSCRFFRYLHGRALAHTEALRTLPKRRSYTWAGAEPRQGKRAASITTVIWKAETRAKHHQRENSRNTVERRWHRGAPTARRSRFSWYKPHGGGERSPHEHPGSSQEE